MKERTRKREELRNFNKFLMGLNKTGYYHNQDSKDPKNYVAFNKYYEEVNGTKRTAESFKNHIIVIDSKEQKIVIEDICRINNIPIPKIFELC